MLIADEDPEDEGGTQYDAGAGDSLSSAAAPVVPLTETTLRIHNNSNSRSLPAAVFHNPHYRRSDGDVIIGDGDDETTSTSEEGPPHSISTEEDLENRNNLLREPLPLGVSHITARSEPWPEPDPERPFPLWRYHYFI